MPPETLSESLQLSKAPSGAYVPPAPAIPGALPLGDAFAVLSPFMDSPALRLGRRGSALALTVDLMLEMQHDELISLLKGYQAALLVNADYEIRCADAAKQRFFEAMYKNVHRSLMLACSPALSFGFQAMIKVFDFGIPATDDDTPVWDGSAEPLILKKVKQIHPDLARPEWEDGSFAGIRVKGMEEIIPPLYSLWLTIGKHHVFGDYFGWGRFRAAYFPWWSKQFVADQEILYIQKGIDPVTKVGHPEGKTDGILNSEIAASVGEAVRAGSTVTIPSTPYATKNGEGFDAQLGSLPQWTLDYLINTADIAPFLNILTRLDKQIAMAMLVPPQAVLETKSLGLGGPNTAEILGTVAEDMLIQDASEIDEHLNEHVFPFLSNANYGPNSPPVTKVTTGLSGRSKANLRAAWEKLIALEGVDRNFIDMQAMTEQVDVPVKSASQLLREQSTQSEADKTAAQIAEANATAAQANAAATAAGAVAQQPAQAITPPAQPSIAPTQQPLQQALPPPPDDGSAEPLAGNQPSRLKSESSSDAVSLAENQASMIMHLRNKHDQRNHGRRRNNPDFPASDRKVRTAGGAAPEKATNTDGAAGASIQVSAAPAKEYRSFGSGDEADAWARTEMKAGADAIKGKEAASMFGSDGASYQMMGAYYINAALRQGVPSAKTSTPPNPNSHIKIKPATIDKYGESMKSAISKSKAPDNITAYRGVTFDDDGSMARVLATWEPGSRHVDKGFMSTTLDKDTASKTFAGDGAGAVIEVGVPKGTQALYMQAHKDSAAGLAHERELLIQAGTPFTVRERVFDDNGNVVRAVIEFDEPALDGGAA